MNRKAYIKVKFQKEGIHCYPAAKDLAGVEFLAYPHRHMFHFTVKLEVFHDDRDIEFILLKRELESLFTDKVMEIDSMSCEMLAENLCQYLLSKYPGRDVEVEVSEDDENSGVVSYVA